MTPTICDLAYKKGPYVSSSLALLSMADPLCFFFIFWVIIDCTLHYTPHQDSFFIFRCYTGSTETFINVICNTTASAIPLITVFANSLRLTYPFRNQKPATNARYYDNITRRNNTSSP